MYKSSKLSTSFVGLVGALEFQIGEKAQFSRGGSKIVELLDAVYYYPNPVSRFKDASSPFSSGHRGHRALRDTQVLRSERLEGPQ
mmetsp:Transcript_8980/g.14184  ORF Transcript_8980/g.14184 Transcript_8980/m.14184 type:complete len:85 (+) Transcript_8980:171-425(+)